ncbi:MAG: HipA domain-containing protein [Burkholderiales bacterium]|nr:HipA domain-containing protein [Burkholderiales bacterium]
MNIAHKLIAYANGEIIGEVIDDNGVWSFEYANEWLANSKRFALCPNLPLKPGPQIDTSSRRPVQWFFDNLLPEEAQRTLLAQEAKVDEMDAWGILAYYGAESAGAITLLPPGRKELETGRKPLSMEELHQRILNLPHKSLDAGAPKHMSLGGAQHKLAVILEKDGGRTKLFEPVGATPSTHIIKPDNRTAHWSHSAINEFFCMRLARSVGLPVPDTDFFRTPEPIYAVERFDRNVVDGQLMRLHVVDGLQLLGLYRALKYERARTATLKQFIDHMRFKANARIELFRWVVFNSLIGNGDAHMKNLSFYVDPTGYRLAPFYDLVSTVVYDTKEYRNAEPFWPNSEFVMPIGGTIHYRDLTGEHFIEAGKDLGLKDKAVHEVVHALVSAVEKNKDKVLKEVTAIAQPTGGEVRLLKSIMAIPLREMLGKLKWRDRNNGRR